MRRLTAAERLLQSLGIAEPGDIDLEAIAWHVGAKVRRTQLQSCEARIIGVGEKAIITVDTSRPRTRQRFSIGHELGHWAHHRGKSSICRTDDIGNRLLNPVSAERVADSYAADLLLPQYIFEPLARQFRKTDLEKIEQLREAFKTSITATALRMVDFGPSPGMVVYHTHAGRKWFHPGRDVPKRWFPRDDLDPQSSAMDVQFGDSERSRQSLIGADAWFDRPEAERYEVLEQTVKIGEDTLSLLIFKDESMMRE